MIQLKINNNFDYRARQRELQGSNSVFDAKFTLNLNGPLRPEV